MRRAVICLAAIGVLAFAVNQASAGVSVRVGTPHVSVGTAVGSPHAVQYVRHGSWGHGCGHYPRYIAPPVPYHPPVVVPYPGHPPVVHPPIHHQRHRHHYYGPHSGFRYRGHGVSVGVRW